MTGEKIHKREANIYAAKALDLALGIRSKDKTNWSCCHIWGVDDPKFQKTNTVIADHRFYSCVANMVLLPTPLKAFTDSMPEIKSMLRICSTNLYGWRCDHTDMENWSECRFASKIDPLLHIKIDPVWYYFEQRYQTVRPLQPGQFWMQIYIVFGSNFCANQNTGVMSACTVTLRPGGASFPP